MTISLSNNEHDGSIPIGHVFGVDSRTGFMPPQPPLRRLPAQWETWESLLDTAIASTFVCSDALELIPEHAAASAAWRAKVREVGLVISCSICSMHMMAYRFRVFVQIPILPVTPEMAASPRLLRRAHLVLAFLLHFYVQTVPMNETIVVPRQIGVPILRVSNILDIPPLLTFSDTVLYNWEYKTPPCSSDSSSTSSEFDLEPPQLDNLRSTTMFTNLQDEEEFYLCSARIELRGVEALELMRQTMDEMFVGDEIAVRRIAGYLRTLAGVVDELKQLLLDVRKGCDPERYYRLVRPWFRGEDSDITGRRWIFEGVGDERGVGSEFEGLRQPTELSGPSAGQSSMVHVLDVFLGVDHQSQAGDKPSFMSRMLTYMPKNHRMFLKHLAGTPRPLRKFVDGVRDEELLESYNQAVLALKGFRDAHMIIATLYIIGPARRAAAEARRKKELEEGLKDEGKETPLKGTGGSDLVQFLKETRNRTGATVISCS